MMDATFLYPFGFHPYLQTMTPDIRREAKSLRRRDVGPIKYYFIDFGLSSRFDDGDVDRLVTGRICQQDVPELSDTVPYDPFAADVYLLGDAYKRAFIEVWKPTLSVIKPDLRILRNTSTFNS